MANPRRPSSSSSLQLHIQTPAPYSAISIPPHSFSSLLHLLKKPASFPFLLSLFLLLTWLSLRFQYPSSSSSSSIGDERRNSGRQVDREANMVRFRAAEYPSLIASDRRGWLLDPVALSREAGLHGGALVCSSLHVGQIPPGALRGNHRHHTCNETFVIWGAETKFRLENAEVKDKGFAEVTIAADEVAIVASPSGTAHALMNVDTRRLTSFLGCQDTLINPNSSNTDYKIWKDL